MGGKRINSDEYYVLGLVAELLGEPCQHGRSFDTLRGDTGRRLKVDGYFARHDLIVEYNERQHYEAVPFFDKRMTASGVTRDQQRRLYDQRRKEWAASNGKGFLVVPYTRLHYKARRKLHRSVEFDMEALRRMLEEVGLTPQSTFSKQQPKESAGLAQACRPQR